MSKRKQALKEWKFVFEQACMGSINKERIVLAIDILNRIDSQIIQNRFYELLKEDIL